MNTQQQNAQGKGPQAGSPFTTSTCSKESNRNVGGSRPRPQNGRTAQGLLTKRGFQSRIMRTARVPQSDHWRPQLRG